MDEDEMMDVQEGEDFSDYLVFSLGNKSVSLNELDQLLSSEDPEDKEKLRSIVNAAVHHNKHSIVFYLIAEGYQLEVLNDKNQTVIHLVYYSNTHPNIFLGSDTLFSNCKNDTDSNGLSHLHIACAIGHVDVVKQFLDNGEDIHSRLTSDCKKNKSGFTPLHFAVAHQEVEVVKLLLERGADVNAVDSSGSTPLHLACAVSWSFKRSTETEALKNSDRWNSELSILELLLEHKSDLDARDDNGNPPLLRIFKSDYYYHPLLHDELVLSDPFEKDELARLLQKRQLEKFNLLFELGVDITVKNYNDESILHCIIGDLKSARDSTLPFLKFYHDDVYASVIESLLTAKKGLDVNARNLDNETPIALAASLISCDIVRVLLDHNADVNSIDIHGPTFFKYPNIIPSVDSVVYLQGMIVVLISKGFEMTLEVNLAIMKFMIHDVDDCDCGNVSSIELLPIAIFYLLSHSCPSHMKRVFMQMYEQSDEKLKYGLLQCCRIGHEFCKLIPYRVPVLDEEILNIVSEHGDEILSNQNYQLLLQLVEQDVALLKSTILNDGVSLFDVLAKYSRKMNIFKYLEINDVKEHMRSPFTGQMLYGVVRETLMRIYIESAAYKKYVHLVLPYLPDLCRKMIIDYLDIEDIVKLCTAALLE